MMYISVSRCLLIDGNEMHIYIFMKLVAIRPIYSPSWPSHEVSFAASLKSLKAMLNAKGYALDDFLQLMHKAKCGESLGGNMDGGPMKHNEWLKYQHVPPNDFWWTGWYRLIYSCSMSGSQKPAAKHLRLFPYVWLSISTGMVHISRSEWLYAKW